MDQRYYSNVYWHFTGSPSDLDGKLITKPSDIGVHGTLKTLEEATEILVTILESRKLLATSREALSEDLQTDRFCCVTDIPLKDLQLHAVNYGKVAIGFRSRCIHKHFLPVLYLPKDNTPMKERLIPKQAASTNGLGQGYRIQRSADTLVTECEPETQSLIENPFLNFIKITDFGPSPEQTFYSEREWRHVGDFAFEDEDIEAVIAPAAQLPELRRCLFDELGYPATLSLFAWEFLENA